MSKKKSTKVSASQEKAVESQNTDLQVPKKTWQRGRKAIPVDYDKLVMYASQKMDNKEIAKILGISESLFYVRMAEDPEFRKAYEAGISNRKYSLEKALLKRAEGYDAQEIETTLDGEGNVTKKKITDKSYVPDTPALIFSLKNLYSDKYKEIVQTRTDINVNINDMRQLSTEELQSMLSSPNVVEADYTLLE